MWISFDQWLVISEYSSIVDLDTNTSFVGIDVLRAEMPIVKAQICIHLQT